jgi:predicted transport protein
MDIKSILDNMDSDIKAELDSILKNPAHKYIAYQSVKSWYCLTMAEARQVIDFYVRHNQLIGQAQA